MTGIRIALEVGKKKAFASALDWPGWCRPGKTEAAAIDALLDYADRYLAVTRLAELEFRHSTTVEVVDRQPGGTTTEFGAPEIVHAAELEAMSDDECGRQLALLNACWTFFDEVCQTVTPELKKGPRGGGRDRDGIIDHVINADRTYARKIGVRTPPFDPFDRVAVNAHHEAVFSAIPELCDGTVVESNGWSVRYAMRRMAWHVLDHAWEMQDKDLSGEDAT